MLLNSLQGEGIVKAINLNDKVKQLSKDKLFGLDIVSLQVHPINIMVVAISKQIDIPDKTSITPLHNHWSKW